MQTSQSVLHEISLGQDRLRELVARGVYEADVVRQFEASGDCFVDLVTSTAKGASLNAAGPRLTSKTIPDAFYAPAPCCVDAPTIVSAAPPQEEATSNASASWEQRVIAAATKFRSARVRLLEAEAVADRWNFEAGRANRIQEDRREEMRKAELDLRKLIVEDADH